MSPWVRTDDTAPHHPKMFRAGLAAFGALDAIKCYCSRNLTDGFLPASDLALVFPGTRRALLLSCIVRLVEVGSLRKAEAGWWVHDYLDYNPSRKEVLSHRAEDRARKVAAGRLGGQRSASARIPGGIRLDSSSRTQAEAKQTAERNPDGIRSPDPIPDPIETTPPSPSESPPPVGSPRARIKFDPAESTISGVLPADFARWRELYPAVDLGREIKWAAEWLTNHPERRRSNVAQFLANWFRRAQDEIAVRGQAGGIVGGLQRFVERKARQAMPREATGEVTP